MALLEGMHVYWPEPGVVEFEIEHADYRCRRVAREDSGESNIYLWEWWSKDSHQGQGGWIPMPGCPDLEEAIWQAALQAPYMAKCSDCDVMVDSRVHRCGRSDIELPEAQ